MKKRQLIILAFSIIAIAFTSCTKDEVDPPVADFYAQSSDVDMGVPVYFYDNSTNDVTTYLWSFPGGDPATSSEKNPEVVYNTPGFYTASLTVSNEGGSDTKTVVDVIEVLASAPIVDFIANKTVVQAGEVVQLTDISTGVEASTLAYKWWNIETPDGQTIYINGPEDIVTFTPSIAGYYDVKLTIGTIYGEGVEIKENFIEVYAPGLTVDNTTPSLIKVEYDGGTEYIQSGESAKLYDTDGDLSITYKITTQATYGLDLSSSWETLSLANGDKTVNFEIDNDYFFLTIENQSVQAFNKVVVNAGLVSEVTTDVYFSWINGAVDLGYYNLWSNTEIQAHFADNNTYIYWNNINWYNYGSENIVLDLSYSSKKETGKNITTSETPKADHTIILK